MIVTRDFDEQWMVAMHRKGNWMRGSFLSPRVVQAPKFLQRPAMQIFSRRSNPGGDKMLTYLVHSFTASISVMAMFLMGSLSYQVGTEGAPEATTTTT